MAKQKRNNSQNWFRWKYANQKHNHTKWQFLRELAYDSCFMRGITLCDRRYLCSNQEQREATFPTLLGCQSTLEHVPKSVQSEFSDASLCNELLLCWSSKEETNHWEYYGRLYQLAWIGYYGERNSRAYCTGPEVQMFMYAVCWHNGVSSTMWMIHTIC